MKTLSTIFFLLLSHSACADVVKVIDTKTGNIELVKTRSFSLAKNIDKKIYSKADINRFVKLASIKNKVDEKLIHAVIKAESSYRKNAISKVGAAGLMQLIPATATRFGVTDRFDVKQNIDGGTKYLKFLLNTFKNTPLALAGYNAGENAVIKYNYKIPNYPETKNYVKVVMENYVTE
jgi:soluble lytic murein transglycosylase-like protein